MLIHLAVAVSVGAVLMGVVIGFDADAVAKAFTEAFVNVFKDSSGSAPPPTAEDLAPYGRYVAATMPMVLPALTMVIHVFNLWLASRIARMSGRLARPVDRLWTAALPRQAVYALAGSVLLAFLPQPVGTIASVLAGTLGIAAALTGLAVLHALTLGNSARGVILFVAYASIPILSFPIVLFALLGAADSFLDFRARRFGGARPTA
jgi:hypothetical protein